MRESGGSKVKRYLSTPIKGTEMEKGFKVKKAVTLDSSPIVLI